MEPFLSPDTIALYVSIPAVLVLFFLLGFIGAPNWLWTIFLCTVFAGYMGCWIGVSIIAAVCLLFVIVPIRRVLISGPLMNLLKKLGMLPVISQTEREAIDAGTVWIEKEFFTGKPNFKTLLGQKYGKLSDEERKFVDGPCQKLCDMVNDWDVQCDGDLSQEAWDFIKKEKFFSFIIPKKYGGLEFSALAVSTIVGKLCSNCGPLGTTVMVPNSLGPAELLLHYGTEKQKDYYLPRLADGREVPCFALTEPTAGSDAGSITAHGEVYKHENGELYVRLNFKKRYITLAAVSSVMGLAFKMYDPDNLLGKGTDLGITVGLVPSDSPGIRLGRRHDPMGSSFFNCPVNGVNIELPISENIMGGVDGVGIGWRMLMNCLAAGRAVTLPASSSGVIKLCARTTGAYAKVRKQFGISIGRFEGIEEPMAEIGGYNYMMDAARVYTCGAVDSGEKPSVVSALAKYHFTEIGREVINHAMDICGGAAISRGPHNILANHYISTPIGITVEGANILTRTMIIFGQGLIRCHPYAQAEVNAVENNDLKAFDKALWKHIGFVVRNHFRAFGLTVTRGWLAPCGSGITAKYYRRISWASSIFAVLGDMAMGVYGGNLKRKEKVTGRLGDMVSWMYIATCVLKRYEDEGRKKESEAYVIWSLDRCMQKLQEAFEGILQNMDVPVLKYLMKGPMLMFFRFNSFGNGPSDKLGTKIAEDMMKEGAQRDHLTEDVYMTDDQNKGIGRLEKAFLADVKADEAVKKITQAMRRKEIPKGKPYALAEAAHEKGIITSDEMSLVKEAYDLCIAAIQVDAFEVGDYAAKRHPKAVE
jgi:acyl-CoA dehydrogenase